MRDIIGDIAKSLNYSMEMLKSAVMNGQINPRDADLVRRRIERLKQPQPRPAQGSTVVEQGLQQLMAQGQQPSMGMPAQEDVAMAQGGVAELPVNMFDEASYAGGGIVAFADGDLVEDEYEGVDYDKMYEKYIKKGLPKSPVSSFYQYDAPRPETGYLKKRMENIKEEGRTPLEVRKLAEEERKAYGIKDIFGPRMEEIKGFKEQAEKNRDMTTGLAGLQAASALLSEPTLARAGAKAFETSGATLLAGQREYVKDVRDASKLAFEAGAAQQAYNMDLYRGDTARAKENRTRYEATTDKLADYDNTFLKSIQDRLGQAAEAGALHKTRVDAARANEGSVNIGHLTSAVQAKNLAVAKVDEILEKKYGSQLKQAQDILSAKNPKAKDVEWANTFIQQYDTMRTEAITQENAILEPAIAYEARRLGINPAEVSTLTSTGRGTATMAKPSKSTMTGEVDKNNPLLR